MSIYAGQLQDVTLAMIDAALIYIETQKDQRPQPQDTSAHEWKEQKFKAAADKVLEDANIHLARGGNGIFKVEQKTHDLVVKPVPGVGVVRAWSHPGCEVKLVDIFNQYSKQDISKVKLSTCSLYCYVAMIHNAKCQAKEVINSDLQCSLTMRVGVLSIEKPSNRQGSSSWMVLASLAIMISNLKSTEGSMVVSKMLSRTRKCLKCL